MREEGGGGQAAPPGLTPLGALLLLCSLPWDAARDLLSIPKVQVYQSGSSMAPGVEEKGSEDWEGQVMVRDHPGPQVVETNARAAPSGPGRVPSPREEGFSFLLPPGFLASRGYRLGLGRRGWD